MDLKEIKVSACPHCGADIVCERRYSKHTNGHYNEERRFSCGYTLTFSPNFMKTNITGECEQTIEYEEKMKKRRAFDERLKKYINKADIDQEYKNRILYRNS